MVQRRDAEGDVEGAVRERQALAVGLDAEVRPGAPLEELAAAEADQRSTTRSQATYSHPRGSEVLRRPALRRAQLEHAVAGPDVAVEQHLEAVRGRAPGAVAASRGRG